MFTLMTLLRLLLLLLSEKEAQAQAQKELLHDIRHSLPPPMHSKASFYNRHQVWLIWRDVG